jgi:hypothetical protein
MDIKKCQQPNGNVNQERGLYNLSLKYSQDLRVKLRKYTRLQSKVTINLIPGQPRAPSERVIHDDEAVSEPILSRVAHMLTPPHHFSIVACSSYPPARVAPPKDLQDEQDNSKIPPPELLYRGSIPAARNLPFLKRLKLKTILYLRKKELKKDDIVQRWAANKGVELKWVKAERMEEENLGMGKNDVSEVLKVGRPVSHCAESHMLNTGHLESRELSVVYRRSGWDITYNAGCRLPAETPRMAHGQHHQRGLPVSLASPSA